MRKQAVGWLSMGILFSGLVIVGMGSPSAAPIAAGAKQVDGIVSISLNDLAPGAGAVGEVIRVSEHRDRRAERRAEQRRTERRADRPRRTERRVDRTYRGERSYDRRRHGPRYRDRRPGFNYYFGGYYYAVPWWSFGIVIAPPARPALSDRCLYWHDRCVANWGYNNPDYYGCMRYHGCD